jgi:hypothetical protein
MPHYAERLNDQLQPTGTVWHCRPDGTRHLVPREKAEADLAGAATGGQLRGALLLAGAAALGYWVGGTKGLIAGVLAPHLLEAAGWRKPRPGPAPASNIRRVGEPLPTAETRAPETIEQQAVAGVLRSAGLNPFGL